MGIMHKSRIFKKSKLELEACGRKDRTKKKVASASLFHSSFVRHTYPKSDPHENTLSLVITHPSTWAQQDTTYVYE